MALVSAKCPNCGGDIQLDDSKETGFCLHCGGKINVQQSINTVKIDKSNDVDKLMKLAENAESSGNNEEAEEYANAILEIDSTNYKAWFIKGKSAGWQSTLGNSRVSEMNSAFTEVLANIQNEDIEVIDDYRRMMVVTLFDIGRAMVDLGVENLVDITITKNDIVNLQNQITILLNSVIPCYTIIGKELDGIEDINADTLLNYAADKIYYTVSNAWYRERNEYEGSKSDMNQYAWQDLIEKNDLFIQAIIKAVAICSDEEKLDKIFDGYCLIRRQILNIPCYSYISYDYGSDGYMRYTGSQDSKMVANVNAEIERIRNIVNESKANIRKRKDEETRNFYLAHPEEHAKDLEEKRTLIEDTKKIVQELEQERSKEQGVLNELQQELGNLGFFQFKDKKEQKQKISDQENVVTQIENKIQENTNIIDKANEFINKFQNLNVSEASQGE